jgi:putative membrane protein
MRKTYLNLSFVLVLIGAVACNTKEQSASGSHDSNEVAEEQNEEKFDDASKEVRNDAEFVAEEVADNHAEVALAKVAVERSNDAEIKRIANDLIKSHEQKIKELGKFASAKAITVPNEPEDSDLRTVTNLREEKDIADFNKKWCKEAIDQHDEAIKEYEDQLDDTNDAELKTWISNTLPTLRKHRDELKACHDKLKDA